MSKLIQIHFQQNLMSQLLFKIMANSYYRHYQQNTLFQDCFNALNASIQLMNSKVLSSLEQIKQATGSPLEPSPNQMSIIIEEQTERSMNQGLKYERWISRIKDQFNFKIAKIKKIQNHVQKLITIYKEELLDISTQAHRTDQYNKQLDKQVKQLKKLNKRLNQENNQLKDQITAQSAQYFLKDNEQIQSVFSEKNYKQYSANQQASKFKIKNQTKDHEKKPQIRKNSFRKNDNQTKKSSPKQNSRVIEPEQVQKKQQKQQKQSNIIQINIREAQNVQENQKWKKLAKKIEELKSKLVFYEDQIQEKEKQINTLKIKIKQMKAQGVNDEEQRKKIKIANTTLRGQKSLLQNQLIAYKKQYTEKAQLCNIQQSENKQLKLQVDNLNQTIKWQTNTIDQLRSSFTKSHSKTNQQYQNKIQKLQNYNQQLIAAIERQEQELQQIEKKSKEIQQQVDLKLKEMTGRIAQLELILQQKNQCIVRMKTKGIGNQNINPNIPTTNQTTYLNQLVRVLTKKLADRDQIIRKLQHTK